MNPECPKCGARMVGPRYEVRYGIERLRYVCPCGYSTTRPTRDAKAPRALSENAVAGVLQEKPHP